MSELTPDEVFEQKDGKKLVFLKGLERLARERGVVEYKSKVITASADFAAVTASYLFSDNVLYEGSADAHKGNCNKGYEIFTVAISESRAKARALRSAFGISACSVEEIVESSPPSTDAQHGLIKHLMKEKGVLLKDAFKLIKVEDADELGQLTKDEASGLINKLQKVK